MNMAEVLSLDLGIEIVIDRYFWGRYKSAQCKGSYRGVLANRETTAFPTGFIISAAWTMASSGPNGLEDVFYWPRCAAVTWWESK
jgi:hypothetical protein